MRYRSYLKWINLCGLLLIVMACKKELPYTMKTGYYAVQDIRLYPNGTVDTLYYTAVGPSIGHSSSSIAFNSNNNGYVMWSAFDGPQAKTTLSDGVSGVTLTFTAVEYELTENSLHCYREYSSSSPVSMDVFNNDITFTYIE